MTDSFPNDASDDFPDDYRLGIDQFNRGEFYACHDTLEAVWIEAPAVDKKFYQGILQVAVGLYHLGNRNWRGAVILMGEALSRLRNYEPDYGGIDLEQLIDDVAELLSNLQSLGPEAVDRITIAPPSTEASNPDQIIVHPPIIHSCSQPAESSG